jgi:peptidylprolyl isomerase
MAQAKIGDTVKIHYTGKLVDGTVFDTSTKRDPVQFKIGQGQLIPVLEVAVMGMKIGETKTVAVPAGWAYGPRRPEMVAAMNRDQLPANINPVIGQQLQIQQGPGRVMAARIANITPTQVVLDMNHPLAGQDLTFEIKLVEIA